MTNRNMPAAPRPTAGALLIGDAFNMRHPLTGGGVTVALSDIVILRDLLRPLQDLDDTAAICKYLESFYTLRKVCHTLQFFTKRIGFQLTGLETITSLQPLASTINILAGSLYKVFCASTDPARMEMRHACFDYLSLGGAFSSGPMSLLSGLNPRPLSLVFHFFAVAVYGVGRLLLSFPSPKRLWLGVQLIYVCRLRL